MKAIQKFDPNEMPKVSYCVSSSIRDLQIRINNQKVKERVQPSDTKDATPVAIVGYGPSLAKTWKQLKKYKTIFACSGATKFLLEKGIVATYHCEVDPREHKKEMIEVHPDTTYLMASAVHPKVIEHLQERNANIKLWHIFATDGESEQVLPRDEWLITGGCDVGMRAMTLARLLGHTNLHIFGIDACAGVTGNHAAFHPNQAKEESLELFEYKGKTYKTTPAWRSCAIQIFRELDQLGDVEFKFFGEGLTQEMAKHYVRKPVKGTLLAFNKPSPISQEMKRLNTELHESNVHYGTGGGKYAEVTLDIVKKLTKANELPPTVLDYGAGKQFLAKSLPFPIQSYDPAVPAICEPPRPADIVLCTDVLEHIEPDKIDIVLDDLKRVTKQIGYFVIHLGPAIKTYADGRNAHLLQETPEWWEKKLKKFFTIGQFVVKGNELHVVVAPWSDPDVTKVGNLKFYTPNETTKWRANTLFKKEPITIEWINSMAVGDTLFDIGANVGMYTIYAGSRGVKVYSFEPEAENFAILSRNLMLNGLEPNAFPMAVSDKSGFDVLHLSQVGAGGSCHSFRDEVGFDGNSRPTKYKQGAIGITLDAILGQVPQPDHIKIDVDGLESKVIKGAIDTLKNVKTLLIEINPKIPAHLGIIDTLKVLGFTYDKEQAEKARRTSGAFEGVGEIIFRREKISSIEQHLIEQIEKAEVINEPYPHFVLEDCFEDYQRLVYSLPDEWTEIEKVRPTKGYPERFVGGRDSDRWNYVQECMTRGAVKAAMCRKFGVSGDFTDETLLIKDNPGYAIGPHTDSPARVLSAIFYLPKGGNRPELGTSLYVPKKKGRTCPGGPHYPETEFKKVKTVSYSPNTAFVFLKTNASFHGVSKTKAERAVLLYDVRHKA